MSFNSSAVSLLKSITAELQNVNALDVLRLTSVLCARHYFVVDYSTGSVGLELRISMARS